MTNYTVFEIQTWIYVPCLRGPQLNMYYYELFQITGEGSERQILSALQAHPERASYMTEALRGLFLVSKNWTERKPEVLQVFMSHQYGNANSNIISKIVLLCVF